MAIARAAEALERANKNQPVSRRTADALEAARCAQDEALQRGRHGYEARCRARQQPAVLAKTWRHVPVAKLDELIPLSLGWEPNDDCRLLPEYQQRMFVAARCLGHTLAPGARPHPGYPDRTQLSMPLFVEWALSVGWEIPAELAVLGLNADNDVQLREMQQARVKIRRRGENPSARKVADESGYDRNTDAFKLRWKRLKP